MIAEKRKLFFSFHPIVMQLANGSVLLELQAYSQP